MLCVDKIFLHRFYVISRHFSHCYLILCFPLQLLAFASISLLAVIAQAFPFPYGPYSAFTGDFGKKQFSLIDSMSMSNGAIYKQVALARSVEPSEVRPTLCRTIEAAEVTQVVFHHLIHFHYHLLHVTLDFFFLC